MFTPSSPLNDSTAETVLTRLHCAADHQQLGIALSYASQIPSFVFGKGVRFDQRKAGVFDDKYISIDPAQGRLLYLLARAIGARRIVEFGTSFGISTIYLACAVRDNGGGVVISSELLPEKVEGARANLQAAGVAQWVELRQGDARETLSQLDAPIDLLLLDGFPNVALDVLRVVEPKLRPGALLIIDDVELFQRDLEPVFDHLSRTEAGYRAASFSVGDGFLLAVRSCE